RNFNHIGIDNHRALEQCLPKGDDETQDYVLSSQIDCFRKSSCRVKNFLLFIYDKKRQPSGCRKRRNLQGVESDSGTSG
ncbi:hypothetical protein J3L11_02170, partial [Shewanella sp. 4t3-1-2LB]|uniref:hypothetical protein n=1 Tax=Shewanella sp. 4t3-1-2LB TaxID=2817682 RepID=UPI001A98D952